MERKKGRFNVSAIPEKCVGCRLCQMRCSFRFTRKFSFSGGRVEVTWLENLHRYGIFFDGGGDACGLCVRSCVYGALELEKREMGGGVQ